MLATFGSGNPRSEFKMNRSNKYPASKSKWIFLLVVFSIGVAHAQSAADSDLDIFEQRAVPTPSARPSLPPLPNLPPLPEPGTESPDAVVRRLCTETIAAMKSATGVQTADSKRAQQMTRAKISSYLDYERMTVLATGKAWTAASPSQKNRLTAQFHAMLEGTYSYALGEMKDTSCKVAPLREDARTENDVVVDVQALRPRTDPVKLQFRLTRTDGGWKIYDANFMGMWLVENYKTSFSSEYNKTGVEGLIKYITDQNRKNTA
jgi:phospholipid transport system substrate-binding protein